MDPRTANHPPTTTYLRDYRAPDFLIERVDLRFALDEDGADVSARLRIQRAPGVAADAPLVLHGECLELVSLALDGRGMGAADYDLSDSELRIARVPDQFELHCVTHLRPQDNTELSGLYKSSGNFCTQCEAEGFRRITYFLDRPDVMARYTTTVSADRTRYPVLLSNGNLVEQGDAADGRHWARWEDPFPKPSYLFALVAGDFRWLEDEFVTLSGRRVRLFIYVQPHNLDMCDHAMQSLKKAMRWDEEVYGREYDLDRFMIVAVDDFNMGAMENKGLNIFNSKFVLARPDTATDQDYQNIEGIVGHEYFHNWSGNRVTCRDWFQLSLKEGFTVFRDQEFSADMGSRAVQRIQDVNQLRMHQFREDAGPMAHPVRPDSYVEINNFYTSTVYNKGAEVVRMLRTLLGSDGFRRGTDLYFERHDGQAVTTEDFVRALEDASGVRLQQFRHWYSQAGTPVVRAERRYDAAARTYTLTFTQRCPPTPGQPDKLPFHIPIAMALLGPDGEELPLCLRGEAEIRRGTRILQLCGEQESFIFENVDYEPVPSLLRGFSAPVRLEAYYDETELGFLFAKDPEPFCRWEAGQQLASRLLLTLARARQAGEALVVPPAFTTALRDVLSAELDPAFRAVALSLPGETYLAEFMDEIDPQALHAARLFLRRTLAASLRDEWLDCYRRLGNEGRVRFDAEAMGRRDLRNLCLSYLMELEADAEVLDLCLTQFERAPTMTDRFAALTALAQRDDDAADRSLAAFYTAWHGVPQVLDKWFAVQATSRREDAFQRVAALTRHPAFSLRNPNRVYALLRNFGQANPAGFHIGTDGASYRFMADQIIALDALNPQVAARLAGIFNDWRRYAEPYRTGMKTALCRLQDRSNLSPDLYEIVKKSLST